MTVRGRRPGPGSARADVIDAARAQFAAHGYDGASIRGIAERARVDPALIYRFFGSKAGLFATAVEDVIRPQETFAILSGDGATRGHRLVHRFVQIWSGGSLRDGWVGVFRAMIATPSGTAQLRAMVEGSIVASIAGHITATDARRRAGLIASQMVGLLLTRYVLEIDAVAEMSDAEVVALYGPVIEHYLRDPLPPTPAVRAGSEVGG